MSIERAKAGWTAVSVVIPLLAAIATVFYGFWSTNRQAELNFQLEAAKALMQLPSGSDVADRINILKQTFPDQLAAFKTPTDFSNAYWRLEFLKLVANRGLTATQAGKLWGHLFDDDWAKSSEVSEIIGGKSNAPGAPKK